MARDLHARWESILATEGLSAIEPNNAREQHSPWTDERGQASHYQACDAWLLANLESDWSDWRLLACYSDSRTGREAARLLGLDDSNAHKRLTPLIRRALDAALSRPTDEA